MAKAKSAPWTKHAYVYLLYVIIPVLTYVVAKVTQTDASLERMSRTYDPYFLTVLWIVAHSFLSYIFVSKLHTVLRHGAPITPGLLFFFSLLALLYVLMVSWHVVLQKDEQTALYLAVSMVVLAGFTWPILSVANVGHGANFGVVAACLLVAFSLNQTMVSIETTE